MPKQSGNLQILEGVSVEVGEEEQESNRAGGHQSPVRVEQDESQLLQLSSANLARRGEIRSERSGRREIRTRTDDSVFTLVSSGSLRLCLGPRNQMNGGVQGGPLRCHPSRTAFFLPAKPRPEETTLLLPPGIF